MSDTENKTETTDTAPYMKKDKTNESAKSNFVIPLVLLLVSAIVIIATFYEDEYKHLIAQVNTKTDVVNDNTADTETTSTENTITEVKALANDEQANTVAATETKITQESETNLTLEDEANTQKVTSVTEAQTAEPVNETVAATSTETTKNADTSTASQNQSSDQINNTQQGINPAANYNVHTQPAAYIPQRGAITNRRHSQEQYNARVAHAQQQAKQYHEMMLKRRQAYEQEIQLRRQQYEAAMQAKRKRKAEFFEAQKAVFQRIQQNRLVTNQKIQEIHDQISALHEEVHQIIRESRSAYEKSDADQDKHSESEIEKI